MDEAGVSHGVKQREAAPQSAKAFYAVLNSSTGLLRRCESAHKRHPTPQKYTILGSRKKDD